MPTRLQKPRTPCQNALSSANFGSEKISRARFSFPRLRNAPQPASSCPSERRSPITQGEYPSRRLDSKKELVEKGLCGCSLSSSATSPASAGWTMNSNCILKWPVCAGGSVRIVARPVQWSELAILPFDRADDPWSSRFVGIRQLREGIHPAMVGASPFDSAHARALDVLGVSSTRQTTLATESINKKLGRPIQHH